MHQSHLLVSPDIRLGLALFTVFGGVGTLLYLAPGRGEQRQRQRPRTAERRRPQTPDRIEQAFPQGPSPAEVVVPAAWPADTQSKGNTS